MHRYITYLGIALLIVLLALIRAFENDLFYDPYLLFFQNDYLYIDHPRREVAKLVGFTSLRYFLNSVISLGIIYLFFKDRGILKFSGLVYVIAYIVILIPFLYFVINPKQEDYYLFFNVRRFLIQPLILLLLLPALYYYKLNKR
ncbi:exosortase F system-associated membrane protein [Winogradskyella sp. A3E31]|uniref:exosortase F system-associated membrane protein n=1 Tax=Winogradskyella sp. A3E31 TaxID=3349637 RepID=UPI00398A5D71